MVPPHKPPPPGDGVTLGQQHRWFESKSGCPKTRAPQSQSKQLPVPTHFGATLVSSPPSWVQGDQGQCGCGQGWPWDWHQPGNLCALSRGLRGQGATATSGPPSSSRCSGDGDVRPCSNVPVPHCPTGGPAVAKRIWPFSHWEGAGLSLCVFPAVPICQHPAGTWSSGTCHHHGLRAATSPCSCLTCRDPLFPCPLPAMLPDHPLFVPACQRVLDLPLGVLLLPHPQPMLASLRCNTSHPAPAGRREPQNPPHFFGGESCLHAQLPQALGLGSSMGVTVAVGAWGQRHRSWPDPLVPFVSQPGMSRGSLQ